MAHSGRGMTLNELCSNCFRVIEANTIVRSTINRCVTCRNLRGKMGQQLMGDLPKKRVQPLFKFFRVHMFGP